jgi:hypothetical protein
MRPFQWQTEQPVFVHVLLLLVLQEGPAPDVWLQLLMLCAAKLDGQPEALRSLAQQLAEQGMLTAEQRQQMLVQVQQLSARQQVGGEQVGGEQGAQVAGLQG